MTGDLDKIAPMSRERLAQEILLAAMRSSPEGRWTREIVAGIVWVADELDRQLAGNTQDRSKE